MPANIISLYRRRQDPPESPVMLRIWRRGQRVEQLEPGTGGWRELDWRDFVDLGGGNWLAINNETAAVNLAKGFIVGCLFSAFVLAVTAVLMVKG